MSLEHRDRLIRLWGEIADLSSCRQLLEWDQETNMPPGAIEGRSQLLATVARLAHDRLISGELLEVVESVEGSADGDEAWAAQAREARRVVDRARKIPSALAEELARARSTGVAAWQEARRRSDFATFAPHLERMLDLKRQEAAALAGGGRPYDALLDEYDPGTTEAALVPLFDRLRRELSPLVRAVAECGRVVDESPARGSFPEAEQRRFGVAMAEAIGFDFHCGRLDRSAHPFCITVHPGDVRLTWRWDEGDFRSGLFGILHEAGHGLYEQGLPAAWARTPLGEAASMGIHESQSRLWENLVGRSRGFWRWALPRFRDSFRGSAGVEVEALWPALHTVQPSLIRVEADEATYNLHIVARFELERRLFAGDLQVAELPAAWDEAYKELLGLRPPDAARGVLQDIHWAMGAFGYFPSYTLGNLFAAQLFAAAERDLGDSADWLGAGELGLLLDWLRTRVHRHGRRYPAAELVRRASGEEPGADALLDYLKGICREVYGVEST